MRYITEQELRDSFAGGVPPRFVLPADCRLTPLAEQYLRDLKLLGGECMPDQRQKPEYMTHLNSREMVYKTHPRILLRGKLDTLESEILLVMVGCGETWRALLQDALMLVRQVLAADVKDAPLPPGSWAVWMRRRYTGDRITRRRSGFPDIFCPHRSRDCWPRR